MKIGTKTLLFGVHQFAIHPIFVAIGWWKLYGFPWEWRLWICFIVHDWGYWGCEDLDGPAGKLHPEWAAATVGGLLDRWPSGSDPAPYTWSGFLLFHSRYYAKAIGYPPSRLCAADKLAICLMPDWLYLLLARLSGELPEYLENGRNTRMRPGLTEVQWSCLTSGKPRLWLAGLKSYMREWVTRHVQEISR